jgi:hypothetical protein
MEINIGQTKKDRFIEITIFPLLFLQTGKKNIGKTEFSISRKRRKLLIRQEKELIKWQKSQEPLKERKEKVNEPV